MFQTRIDEKNRTRKIIFYASLYSNSETYYNVRTDLRTAA